MLELLSAHARQVVRRFPMLADQMRTSTGMVHRRGGVFRLPPGFGSSLSPLAPHRGQQTLRAAAFARLAQEVRDRGCRFWTCVGCGFANPKSDALVCNRCDRDAAPDLPVLAPPRGRARGRGA